MKAVYVLVTLAIFGLCYTLDIHVRRYAENSGFHRQLITAVELEGVYVEKVTNCTCLLIENIPSGIYVDLHELKSQESHGGPQVYSTSKIDIEKPEYWSTPHEVYVWHHFVMTAVKVQALQISMPIHLRYHRPMVDQDFIQVSLGAPKLFLQCAGTNDKFRGLPGKDALALCDNTKDSNYECEWREVDYVKNGNFDDYVVKMQVPLGNQNHNNLVVIATLTFTVGGTLYLVYHICVSNQNRDLVALIKSHERAKSKFDRHFSGNHFRDKRFAEKSKHEVLKDKLKALLFKGETKDKEVSNGVHSRKRYK